MKTLYLILGMHRSGTSLTIQLLQKMNVWVGNDEQMLLKDQYNERGYGELKDLVQIDDLLLTKSKLMWYSIKKNVLDKKFADFLVPDFVKEHIDNEHENIAIKDPRLTIIWKTWLGSIKNMDRMIKGIVVIRNPFEVAESLYKRNQMEQEYALCLWYEYNWQCLLFSTEHETIWMDYTDYFCDLLKLSNELWTFVYGSDDDTMPKLESIVDEKIRHFKHSEYIPRGWVAEKALDFYTTLRSLVKGECDVETILCDYLVDYQKITEYGLKISLDTVEESKVLYLKTIVKRPEKYWEYFLEPWLEGQQKPIVLCGNGNNLEKLLPLLERKHANIAGIYDGYNFTERFYKDRIIKICSWDNLKQISGEDIVYLITPFYANESEIFRQVTSEIAPEKVYKLSDILLKNIT